MILVGLVGGSGRMVAAIPIPESPIPFHLWHSGPYFSFLRRLCLYVVVAGRGKQRRRVPRQPRRSRAPQPDTQIILGVGEFRYGGAGLLSCILSLLARSSGVGCFSRLTRDHILLLGRPAPISKGKEVRPGRERRGTRGVAVSGTTCSHAAF
ncbi:hypothetical protein N657DRAFT_145876 [Parathielavia appendiculata]|uniref:Uncharacterized protein n=1 Tax=Parathielavia appendiculata TaxID=2587402 RepID=A0AAN6TUF9_9PEZI|nr:hypothetical protein N657DRAFT_145876 [Parathielavia appendiculata]